MSTGLAVDSPWSQVFSSTSDQNLTLCTEQTGNITLFSTDIEGFPYSRMSRDAASIKISTTFCLSILLMALLHMARVVEQVKAMSDSVCNRHPYETSAFSSLYYSSQHLGTTIQILSTKDCEAKKNSWYTVLWCINGLPFVIKIHKLEDAEAFKYRNCALMWQGLEYNILLNRGSHHSIFTSCDPLLLTLIVKVGNEKVKCVDYSICDIRRVSLKASRSINGHFAAKKLSLREIRRLLTSRLDVTAGLSFPVLITRESKLPLCRITYMGLSHLKSLVSSPL